MKHQEHKIPVRTLSDVSLWLGDHSLPVRPSGTLLIPTEMWESASERERTIFQNICRIYNRRYEQTEGISGPIVYAGPIE